MKINAKELISQVEIPISLGDIRIYLSDIYDLMYEVVRFKHQEHLNDPQYQQKFWTNPVEAFEDLLNAGTVTGVEVCVDVEDPDVKVNYFFNRQFKSTAFKNRGTWGKDHIELNEGLQQLITIFSEQINRVEAVRDAAQKRLDERFRIGYKSEGGSMT